jgi:hypothetical protein
MYSDCSYLSSNIVDVLFSAIDEIRINKIWINAVSNIKKSKKYADDILKNAKPTLATDVSGRTLATLFQALPLYSYHGSSHH